MRRRTRLHWLSVAVVAGAVFAPAALRASGTSPIDTTGTTMTPGAAPVPGEVLIQDGTDLGATPDIGYVGGSVTASPSDDIETSPFYRYFGPGPGLGGPALHVQTNVTLPGGTYDVGDLIVDRGVTVTFTSDVEIRAAKDVAIDGRIELAPGATRLGIHCAGNFAIHGHTDVATGLFADEPGASIGVVVGGSISLFADTGARAHVSASGERGRVTIDRVPPSGPSTTAPSWTALCQRTDFDAGDSTLLRFITTAPVVINDCSGPVHFRSLGDVTVRGGTWTRGLRVIAGRALELEGDVSVTGDACILGADATSSNDWETGDLTIASGCSIDVSASVAVACSGDLTVGEGATVRAGGAIQFLPLYGLDVGAGALVEETGANQRPDLAVRFECAATTIRSAGTFRSSHGMTIRVFEDVVLEGGAVVDANDATLQLAARGAVVAEGGSASVSAGDIDVRCSTGDLDLDLATMRATAGRIATLSNGAVRLRGSYSAARDIQVLSLRDVVNVETATLATDDVTSGISGFVRLATYGSPTTVVIGGDLPPDGDDGDDDAAAKAVTAAGGDRVLISAASASLATGDSDAQSGGILLQNQESGGGTVAKASIRVARSIARRTPRGVVTQIKGTLSVPRGRVKLEGSGRVVAGSVVGRLLLGGRRGNLTGAGDGMKIRIVRATSSRPSFVVEVTEPAADEGATARVALHTAGFHVRTAFRRPRVR